MKEPFQSPCRSIFNTPEQEISFKPQSDHFILLVKIPLKLDWYACEIRMVWILYYSQQERQNKMTIVVEFEIRKFSLSGLIREEEMISIIVSLLLVLCAFFIMCILIIGKRADHKKELLFIDSRDDLQEVNTFSSLPPRTRAELRTWVSLHPQQNW